MTDSDGADRAAAADLSSVHVVVPLRGVESGKSRLGQALDAEEREVLVLGLLGRTLDVLAAWPQAQRVYLVTGDAATADLARRAQPTLTILSEPRDGGLNAALRAARDAAAAAGATAVLMLPADLPLLEVAALDRLLDGADAALAAGNGHPLVVVAPADARGGTNALLVSPPNLIEPSFGESSLAAHLLAASQADATVQLVIDPALGFDLDTPDDLMRLDTDAVLALEQRGQQMLAAQAAST
ncbi:MAG: 2-phospho-L-lactate guanylyltransferase [Chloroflexota bacterium]|nr:2-phospho-L-lactate guanylyltransferase [Chloroflexota bacterium]